MMPNLPPLAYQTYRIASPIATHRRPASCAEVECDAWRFGWSSRLDQRTPMGKVRAEYIRHGSGRQFREVTEDDGQTRFDFPPGQDGFGHEHTVLIRPETYVVQVGDYRLPHRQLLRRHTRPIDWVEDCGEHLERVRTEYQRG